MGHFCQGALDSRKGKNDYEMQGMVTVEGMWHFI